MKNDPPFKRLGFSAKGGDRRLMNSRKTAVSDAGARDRRGGRTRGARGPQGARGPGLGPAPCPRRTRRATSPGPRRQLPASRCSRSRPRPAARSARTRHLSIGAGEAAPMPQRASRRIHRQSSWSRFTSRETTSLRNLARSRRSGPRAAGGPGGAALRPTHLLRAAFRAAARRGDSLRARTFCLRRVMSSVERLLIAFTAVPGVQLALLGHRHSFSERRLVCTVVK